MMQAYPYHGVVLDFPTMMKTTDSKQIVILSQCYPTIHVTPSTPLDQAITELKAKVANSKPRFLRSEPRIISHVPVILKRWSHHASPEEKAVTQNISPKGAFVLTPNALSPGAHVYLTFPSAAKPRPILAQVRWSRPWGATDAPGLALCYCEQDLEATLPALHRLKQYFEG